ncbi:MAG: DUF3021 domain-containing protein [Clostridia bacterium]|nr:DUF3021 domain-containing protein [Clostridia bacterium]
MTKKLMALIERWITIKIGVEVRCCLTFFLMAFFYCMYRLLTGSAEASIWHLAEMMGAAYIFGWIQALLHADFDEMDRLGLKEWAVLISGAAVYALTAWLGGWFAGSALITGLFFVYMVGCGLATLLIYYIKRTIDSRLLVDDLREFQQRTGE